MVRRVTAGTVAVGPAPTATVQPPVGGNVDIFTKLSTTKNTISEPVFATEELKTISLPTGVQARLKERLASRSLAASVPQEASAPVAPPPPAEPQPMAAALAQLSPTDRGGMVLSMTDGATDAEEESKAPDDRSSEGFSDDFYSLSSPKTGPPTMPPAAKGTYVAPSAAATNDGWTHVIPSYPLGNGGAGPVALPPWAWQRFQDTGRGYCPTNAAVALHEEAMDFVDWLRPTEAELIVRRNIDLEVSEIAKELWPGCSPCAYGSISTHLMLPSSDLDMTILDVPANTEDALLSLCKEIAGRRLGVTAFPQMILKTKVPLLKFATKIGGVEVDVSINAGDGKTNSALVKRLTAQFPESKILIPLVKVFLAQREMNEPFRGTLGSFATTLLVLSFLQLHPIYTTHTELRPIYGVGRLLVDFFRYYSNGFNFSRVGLSLSNGGSCFRRDANETGPKGQPAQVLVKDPGNPDNNVASSLRQFPSVRTAFDGAYSLLTAPPGVALHGSQTDPRRVSPATSDLLFRPTLLSRIIHRDDAILSRREKAQQGLDDMLRGEGGAERVERVRAFKQEEDAPMLNKEPSEPLSDPVAALRKLAADGISPDMSVSVVRQQPHQQQQPRQQQPYQQQQQHHRLPPQRDYHQQQQPRRDDREQWNSQPRRTQPAPLPPAPAPQSMPSGRGDGGRGRDGANQGRIPPPPRPPSFQGGAPPRGGGGVRRDNRSTTYRRDEDSSDNDDQGGWSSSWQAAF